MSIVLPVYNEADQIAACLGAIARQTVQPFEVIVVDNNSSDATAAVAASFPFVRLLHEPKQGVVHARNRGFNAARGEIIGRIDADTIMPTDWMAMVRTIFEDDSVDAASGTMTYRGIAAAPLFNKVDLLFRRHFARVLGREVALQGASMALRRQAWRHVRANTCVSPGLHEDFDLAIHLNQAGYRVRFDERLRASIGYRQAASSWRDFVLYAATSPRTYGYHGLTSKRYMYKVVVIVAICYPVLRLLHRGYDSERQRFSWYAWINNSLRARVNPASFVDR